MEGELRRGTRKISDGLYWTMASSPSSAAIEKILPHIKKIQTSLPLHLWTIVALSSKIHIHSQVRGACKQIAKARGSWRSTGNYTKVHSSLDGRAPIVDGDFLQAIAVVTLVVVRDCPVRACGKHWLYVLHMSRGSSNLSGEITASTCR